MPIFAVTRSGEQEPFLLLDAFDETQAVEHVNSLDMIGALRAEGYRDAAGSYSAVLASSRQVARWNSGNLASISGPGRHAPEAMEPGAGFCSLGTKPSVRRLGLLWRAVGADLLDLRSRERSL
jgi:hypothetical protein